MISGTVKNQSDYIILVGPGERVYNDNELQDFENGLKKQGVNVVRIGDASTPLKAEDYNKFYAEIKASTNPKIVFWGHGAVFRDYQLISMGEQISLTTDLLTKTGEALQNKAADILVISCKGGGVIPNIKEHLPSNCNVYSLVTGNDNLSNYDLLAMIKALNELDISKGNLTVDQLLLTFLMSNEVYKSLPLIYPEKNYTTLKEKYSSVIGHKFSAVEKDMIVEELSKYSSKENILEFIAQIENPDSFKLLDKYGQLLALSLVCARTEKYQFNTNAISSMFGLFFNTVGNDLLKNQNPIIRNTMKVLLTLQLAHQDALAALMQLQSADKQNETKYLYNILMNKFAPLLKNPETPRDWIFFSLSTSLLMQAGLNIETLWLGQNHQQPEGGIKSYISSALSATFLSANLAWLLNDYSQNNFSWHHPAVAPLLTAANNFLSALLEKNWANDAELPESTLYYLLRDEAVSAGALIVTFIANLNFLGEKTTPQLLNLSLNALNVLEKLIEVAYKIYNGKYSNEANQAILLNLQILQKLGKDDEIIKKLDHFDWSQDPIDDADSSVVKKIKEFAANYLATSAQQKVSVNDESVQVVSDATDVFNDRVKQNPSFASTASLLRGLQTAPARTVMSKEKMNDDNIIAQKVEADEESAERSNVQNINQNQSSITGYLKSGFSHFSNAVEKFADGLMPMAEAMEDLQEDNLAARENLCLLK